MSHRLERKTCPARRLRQAPRCTATVIRPSSPEAHLQVHTQEHIREEAMG